MIRYDLAKMLAEIRRDERPEGDQKKKVLTQEEIKAMARSRRKPAADKAAKP